LFLIKISKLRTAFSFWARYFIATDKIAIFANIARQTADSGNYEILCFFLAAGQGANKKQRWTRGKRCGTWGQARDKAAARDKRARVLKHRRKPPAICRPRLRR